jgi:hypothetical protein
MCFMIESQYNDYIEISSLKHQNIPITSHQSLDPKSTAEILLWLNVSVHIVALRKRIQPNSWSQHSKGQDPELSATKITRNKFILNYSNIYVHQYMI